MTARRKLIVVSNRGPLGFALDETGERVARRGAGGLVTALRPLVSQHEVTWIASALSAEDRVAAAEGTLAEQARDGAAYRLRFVDHDSAAFDLYYNVVANPVLWFVQHGLWELKHPLVELEAAWRDGYEVVNRAFADAVCDELEREPDAAVFFHDYHLYLAPGLVRARAPEAVLAHFLHIPWVGPEGWRMLPEPIVRAVHEGLLANDVVGFHTDRWRRAFLDSCETLGLDPGGTLVTAHPIAPDVAEFEELAESPAVLERERELVADRPERLVLRVDRTDPSKNVWRGLEAFELLLERRPDLHGRIVLLAFLDPSRQSIPEYVEERARIEAAAARLEARFPGALRLRIADDFPQSVAAYKQFDVLLVNAIMDGLNLVAKEAPLVNTRDGVVVLSVNAGCLRGAGALGAPRRALRRRGPGGRSRTGARAAGERAPRASRVDPGVRPRARPRCLDRGAALRPRARDYDSRVSDLSHVDASGAVHMVDVGGKPLSRRRAVARGSVRMAPETARRLRELPKGDALTTAQLAGIMAAKRTSDLIPLCHPLALSSVDVVLEVQEGSVEITATAEIVAQTGVEMEALVAVSVAALTVYDMAKAVDKGMVISEIQLVEKTKEPL